MIQEFDGTTEKEAIEKAITELNLNREEFDVEIVESTRGGLFRKGQVKIRVHVQEEEARENTRETEPGPQSEFESRITSFLSEMLRLMGYESTVEIYLREEGKIGIHIISDRAGLLIGKKGKNLDAIQLLVNVFSGKIGSDIKVIVDSENYRSRREEALERLARRTAEQVRKSRGSRLLDPMNPFERRIIHTTLNSMDDIDTKSEGEGLYKQVRVIYRGTEGNRV